MSKQVINGSVLATDRRHKFLHRDDSNNESMMSGKSNVQKKSFLMEIEKERQAKIHQTVLRE